MSQIASLIQLSQSLSQGEKLDLAMELLTALKGGQPMAAAGPAAKAPAKASKAAKAPADPDAPKKESTWWIKATQHIRGVLAPSIEAYNAAQPKGAKKMAGTVPTSVGRMLKEAGKLSADTPEPSDDDILRPLRSSRPTPLSPRRRLALWPLMAPRPPRPSSLT